MKLSKDKKIVAILELPSPDYFQSKQKNIFPLLKFYDWVIRNSNPVVDILSTDEKISEYLKNIDISNVVIHNDYDAELRKVTKKYLMKTYRAYAKQAQTEVAWHFLDVGPSTIEIEGLKPNQVCLLEGYLKNEQR